MRLIDTTAKESNTSYDYACVEAICVRSINSNVIMNTDVEANTHFFLYFPLFSNLRYTLLSTVNDIDSSVTSTNDSILTQILLFGKASLDISRKWNNPANTQR